MILADRDKEKMDEELRTALKGYCTLEWHTRMGFPHSISDLQRVAAGQAKTVILLNPEGEEVAVPADHLPMPPPKPVRADEHGFSAAHVCLLERLRSSVAGHSLLCGYQN